MSESLPIVVVLLPQVYQEARHIKGVINRHARQRTNDGCHLAGLCWLFLLARDVPRGKTEGTPPSMLLLPLYAPPSVSHLNL